MISLKNILGREESLFQSDLYSREREITQIIQKSNFLVIGAAGSIGSAVTKEIFKRNPKVLHCIDINENNLVELVRDIRSEYGYISGEFKSFVLDIGSDYFSHFMRYQKCYDFILNLSALKHVRSEKDLYSLLRMIDTNIFYTEESINLSIENKCKNYFCVSSDKAANPANIMGASKRLMENVLYKYSKEINISSARFANVAFSNGSLLSGFISRINKRQPLSGPNDIERYFISHAESGELCLLSALFGIDLDIFIPKISEKLPPMKFDYLAERVLSAYGYESYFCDSEDEARSKLNELVSKNKWPCFFSASNTTGEKMLEEFVTSTDQIDSISFHSIDVIKKDKEIDISEFQQFKDEIISLKKGKKALTKDAIIDAIIKAVPSLQYEDKGTTLEDKM